METAESPRYYDIVCPDCKAKNTLVIKHTSVSMFKLEAIASPSRKDRGTFIAASDGDKVKTNLTICTDDLCTFVCEGWPVASRIVKEAIGD